MERDLIYMADILDSARLAIQYVRDVDEAGFHENFQLQDAVIRRLEIIGEAARRVSETGRVAYPQLPWRLMIGMRNFIIHQYDSVDVRIVWGAVRNDLPTLVAALTDILGPSGQ